MLLQNLKIMKNLISAALLCLSIGASAQISFAGKANVLFPTGSSKWKDIKGTLTDDGKKSAGFNVGLSASIETPTSLFVMPEIYYTHFKNEYKHSSGTTIEAKSDRIDVPVLLGYNVLGKLFSLYAGPVASYNFSGDNTYSNFKENATKDFMVGYQFGAQTQLKGLILSARYEGAFSKDTRKFINTSVGSETIEYDNRPSFVLLGLGIVF